MEQCGGTVLVEQWNSESETVEQCRWNSDGRTVRGNSGTVLVEQCGGTGEECWYKSGTVMEEQCGGKVEHS